MKYFDRKRKEAEEVVVNLRNYCNESNTSIREGLNELGYGYPQDEERLRKLVYFTVNGKDGTEDFVKTLNYIKGSIKYRSGKNLKKILQDIEHFKKIPEEEKMEALEYQTTQRRNRKSYIGLERWIEDAKPIVQNILETDLEKMIGFEYYSHFNGGGYGEGAIYKRIIEYDGKSEILFDYSTDNKPIYTKSFSAYGEASRFIKKSDSKEIASEILDSIQKKETDIGLNSNEIITLKENIIRGIKKRTRRDINKEIAGVNN